MTRKQLNTEQMINELKGQSVFFRVPAPSAGFGPGQGKDSHPLTAESQPISPALSQETVERE